MKRWNSRLATVMFLSIVGILVSLYLTYNHLAITSPGSVCDINDLVSCSLVNSSVFSEIFNVPVASLGIVWFILAFLLAWKGRKNTIHHHLLFWWSVLGLLSIAYFIIAEFILVAFCLFCTIVHALIVLIFILMLPLVKGKKPGKNQLFKAARSWLVFLLIALVLLFLWFNVSFLPEENHDELAKCLADKGVIMYGSFRCGVCAKTRSMFGSSFQYITEIECHPQGKNSQTELCVQKEIEGTPTWILEPEGQEVKRYTGFLSTDELKEFAGCP